MSNIIFQTLTVQGERKRSESASLSPDFSSVNIGSDALAIGQGGSGAGAYFNFGSRALRTSFAAVNANDIPNKAYVDGISAGILVKDAVRLSSVEGLPSYNPSGSGLNKTLTGAAFGALSLDNNAVVAGNRVLIKDETSPLDIHNGIYVVTNAGSPTEAFILTRATDFDGTPSNEVKGGCFTFVQEGDENADSGWVVVSNGAITVDVSPILFSQFSGAGQLVAGDALEKIGNTIHVRVDNSTIEVNADKLRVKAGGITGSQLSIGAVGTTNISAAAVDENKIAGSVAGDGLAGGAGSPLSVGAGDAIKVGDDDVSVNFAVLRINSNAGAIAQNQIVYIKPDGSVDLASKANASNNTELAIVEDASIASADSGRVIVRRGAIVAGFTGLVPGRLYHSSSAGNIDLFENISFVSGDYVYIVGRAISSTELLFNPIYDFTY